MGIWLKDAMKIEPFSRAQLIAGINGIDRMVVAANIQEVPDVDKWLYGGEILFTAGYAFGSVENACALLEKLNAKGVAAMVIKPGQYFREIPKELITKANELGFPLFKMPADLPYMDCILPIMLSITNERQFAIERSERIHNQLLNELLEGRGLDGIAVVLGSVTGRTVSILSDQGILLSYEEPVTGTDSYEDVISDYFKIYLATGRQRRLLSNKCNMIDLGEAGKHICIPVLARDACLAYMLIACRLQDIPNTDLIALENASSLVAIDILRSQALMQREQSIGAQLLDDIVSRKFSDSAIIYQRLAYVGFDAADDYMICDIGVDDFESYLRDRGVNETEETIQAIKTGIQTIIRTYLKDHPRRTLVMENGMGYIVLLSVQAEGDLSAFKHMAGELLMQLRAAYPDLRFSAGFGNPVSEVERINISRSEAELARKVGRTLNTNKARQVTTFNELGCMRFLGAASDDLEMRKFYHEYLGPILSYDKQNGTELVKTLEAYFENNQKLKQTAEALFVHKNSVIYRIKKIEDILGESLDDSEIAFNLQMCLKIREII